MLRRKSRELHRRAARNMGKFGTIPACTMGSSVWRDTGFGVRACVMAHVQGALELLESMEET